jgi:hypothetical protein
MQTVLSDFDDHLSPVGALEGVKQRADGIWTHLHK